LARAGRSDTSIVVLEAGLCVLILAAPLPFGSVTPAGRLTLEILALALLAVWSVVAIRTEVALPPRAVRLALLGFLVIGALQLIPLGDRAVALISPHTAAVREGLEPTPSATLSVAGQATASAVRTGAALIGILLVATTVAAARGARRIAFASLIAAAFQGLYGILVLASGHDRIWNVPKTSYLDSATGTFVNRNHFAGFLAATLPMGVGLVIALVRKAAPRDRGRRGLAALFGPDGSRALLLGLLLLTGVAGILVSFSRAGTAFGLVAISGTAILGIGGKASHKLIAIGVLVAIASVPLFDLGADRLAARYATAQDDYRAPGGRLDVAADTIRMIRAFPAAGCGFGTFTWAFPAFSSPQIRLHYTHAHNDALQLGAEGGLPSLLLLAIVLAALARSLVGALKGEDPVVAGAGLGLAALLAHGLIDFNFHIPANAAIAAVLAGVLFGASWNDRS
jgi:O-antigen ligase